MMIKKRYNIEIGRLGEGIAKKYLEDKGYSILKQGCRNKYGEIDLIAQDKDILIFVEVKTRIGEQFGIPEDSLKRDKIQRLVRNAQAYIARLLPLTAGYGGQASRARETPAYRIDAVCIVLNKDKGIERIEHYENITVI